MYLAAVICLPDDHGVSSRQYEPREAECRWCHTGWLRGALRSPTQTESACQRSDLDCEIPLYESDTFV